MFLWANRSKEFTFRDAMWCVAFYSSVLAPYFGEKKILCVRVRDRETKKTVANPLVSLGFTIFVEPFSLLPRPLTLSISIHQYIPLTSILQFNRWRHPFKFHFSFKHVLCDKSNPILFISRIENFKLFTTCPCVSFRKWFLIHSATTLLRNRWETFFLESLFHIPHSFRQMTVFRKAS